MKLSHKYVRTKVSADYVELTYYKGTFKDINGKDHRLEYIFLPRTDINIGPRVLLYLYPVDGPSVSHRDDILYVLRSLYF